MTTDGKVYTAGDVESEVSIQSISKVFTMAKVMEESGPDAIASTIGVDATGMRFNSIVSIELSQKALGGPEMNALVNPGAIAATSMVKGATRDEVWKSILGYYSDFAGRPLSVNQEVFKSEADTNQRNQAIGYLMYAYGYIKANPMQATDVYTEQCSVSVNAKDLATMAGTLANAGKNPVTGKQVMKADYVPKVLAVMATAGLYDDSGKWFFRTGLPGKSGVGGGLIAVSPGRFGIAVVSPPHVSSPAEAIHSVPESAAMSIRSVISPSSGAAIGASEPREAGNSPLVNSMPRENRTSNAMKCPASDTPDISIPLAAPEFVLLGGSVSKANRSLLSARYESWKLPNAKMPPGRSRS